MRGALFFRLGALWIAKSSAASWAQRWQRLQWGFNSTFRFGGCTVRFSLIQSSVTSSGFSQDLKLVAVISLVTFPLYALGHVWAMTVL